MKNLIVVPLAALLLGACAGTAAAAPGYGSVNLAQGIAVTPLTGTVLGAPAYVTDGKAETSWYSMDWDGAGYANRFVLDLGASYSIGKISAYTTQTTAFTVSSSADGVNWTVRHAYDWMLSSGVSTPDMSPPVTLRPDGAYSARYLKYEGRAVWNQYVGILEFEVYEWRASVPPDADLSGLTNFALGKTATGYYASAPGHGPDAVTDGDPSTYWQPAYVYDVCTYVGYWCQGMRYNTYGAVGIDLGSEQTIQAIRISFANGLPGLQTYLLSVGNVPNAWFPNQWVAFGGDPAAVASNPAITHAETLTFFLPAPATGRYVYFFPTTWVAPTPGVSPNIAEVEVLGEPPVVETFTITASAAAYGAIAPSGAVTVNAGSSQSFIVTADPWYHVADVVVDGGSVGAVATYTFDNVSGDHTIVASFAVDTFTVTASAGGHGTITPSGAVSANAGDGLFFNIAPDAGYHVADVLVDGVSVGAVTSYGFKAVFADHVIAATFAADVVCPTLAQVRAHVVAYRASLDVKNDGQLTSLLAKLDAAQASLYRGNANSFRAQLGAFINEVRAQAGKGITAGPAATLIAEAQALLNGCSAV